MKVTDERFLALALAIPAVQTYNVFLPSVYEIERDKQPADAKRSVRTNLYICDSIVVVAGVVTSIYVGESLPLFVALFVAGYMTLAYDFALKTEPMIEGTEHAGDAEPTA